MGAVLTTGQLAELVGVDRKTVVGWINRGLLTAHCLPGDRDRRVAVNDALHFARQHHLHTAGLQRLAQREGLVPLCPHVLLVTPDKHLVMPLASTRLETTVAPDVLQCGLALASTVFDGVVMDAALGMLNVCEVSTWLSERTPQTVIGLLANEDDAGTLPPGVSLSWQKPADMRQVGRELLQTIKGAKSV